MTGRFQRHQPSSRISVLLLGIAMLWAETVTSHTSQEPVTYSETYTATFVTEEATPTQASSTTTNAATGKASTTMAAGVSTARTNITRTNGEETAPNQDQDNDSNGTNEESAPEKIGSLAIAGLCLVIIALLLIAINGYVLFKSRIHSCTSKRGIFKILPMSVIKKDEEDVEDNFKEDADAANKTDSSTSLTTKESPADQAGEQNGDVHVKVEIAEVAGSSTKENDDGEANNPAENVDDKDVAPVAVVDGSDKPEEERVEKKNETVVTVTVESGNGSQNEQP